MMAAEGFVASKGAVSVRYSGVNCGYHTLPGSSRNSYSTRTIGRFCILCKQQLIPLTFKRRIKVVLGNSVLAADSQEQCFEGLIGRGSCKSGRSYHHHRYSSGRPATSEPACPAGIKPRAGSRAESPQRCTAKD